MRPLIRREKRNQRSILLLMKSLVSDDGGDCTRECLSTSLLHLFLFFPLPSLPRSLTRACVRMPTEEYFLVSAFFFHRADAPPSSLSSIFFFFLSSLPSLSLLRYCLFSALSLSLCLSCVRGINSLVERENFFRFSHAHAQKRVAPLVASFSTTRMRKKLSHKARESRSPHSSLFSHFSLCAPFSLSASSSRSRSSLSCRFHHKREGINILFISLLSLLSLPLISFAPSIALLSPQSSLRFSCA